MDRPRTIQEKLNVAQLLGRGARDFHDRFAFVFAVVFAPHERREELSVESGGLAAQTIVSGWGTGLTEELLLKTKGQKPGMDAQFSGHQCRQQGDICIQRAQRRIIQGLSIRVTPIKPMCPAPDNYNLIEPRFEGG